MKKYRKAIVQAPIIGKTILFFYRAKIAFSELGKTIGKRIRWLFRSNEVTNFTYDLEENNKLHLAALIADVVNIDFDQVMAYFKELEEDADLRKHINEATAKSDFNSIADKDVNYGRRIGWYALVRHLKPKILIETGIDKGLGACVLTAALIRNQKEGHEGHYYGTDINPEAGYLLSGEYAEHGSILYGDSIESLNHFGETIDFFINDSDHSSAYEAEEYKTIASKLSENAIILGDNSHCSGELLKFSLGANRDFIFFQESPRDHWYPGAGIGISFRRARKINM